MSASMKCLNVEFKDGDLQEGLLYFGEMSLVPSTQPILSSVTHKRPFQATSVADQGVEECSQSTTAMEVDSDKNIDELHLENYQYLNRGNRQGEKIIPTSNPRPVDAVPLPFTSLLTPTTGLSLRQQATADPNNMFHQSQSRELAQFEQGDISFKTKMDCNFVRNPFASPYHVKVSTSGDVLQCPFSSTSCTQQELPHGYGSLKTVTGKLIYSGFWFKGKRHGAGEGHIITLLCDKVGFQDGYYTGGWKNNMRHGTGKMTFVSGTVYKGQWEYDKMTGLGTLKALDGTLQGGKWKEGSLVTPYAHLPAEYDQNRGQPSSFEIDKDTSEKLTQTQLIVENLHLKMKLYNVQTKNDELNKEYQAAVFQVQQSFNAQWEQKCKEYEKKIQKAEEFALERANKLNKVLTEKDELVKKYHADLYEMHQRYSVQWMQKFKESKEYAEKLQKCEESALEKTNRLYQLQRELQEYREKQQCQICFDRQRDCIIIPCNHFLYCGTCVTRLREDGSSCPVCRGDIRGEILPIQ